MIGILVWMLGMAGIIVLAILDIRADKRNQDDD